MRAQSPNMLSLCTFSIYMNKIYFTSFAEQFAKTPSKAGRTEMLTRLWNAAYDMGGLYLLFALFFYIIIIVIIIAIILLSLPPKAFASSQRKFCTRNE